MNDSLQRAIPSPNSRKANSGANLDIVSSTVLFKQSFMGAWTDEQIVESIRRTREEFREPKFTRFGGKD